LVLVLEPWHLQGAFSSMLAVAGGFCWAASAVVVKRFQAAHGEVDILDLTTWQMLFGSLPLVAIAALTWQGGPEWTTQFTLALAYNVILGNALAWFLWLFGLRRLSAGAAGIATLATPVIGVAAAWIQLGERPSAGEAAGMALIIGALAVVTARGLVSGRRPAETPPE
jgi:drug/metabolite transporter (DMT)-like permease